ncbi:MAG: citrate synthase [Actinobacteria bacterium]|nr:citrate synthase [Actinomycetota bacterium]NIS36149.1 citrate synthase [Actinomycetota bacterium]NIT98559.1 citrate synthase [Actinomycetota bacterium]NIU22186.1 citrate synthase [Actinomycetota bacterium]NIU70722.1 citrate synthase [Actinomycetota bacterium]
MAESITITDNRTGESIEIPIEDGGVDAAQWRKLLPGIWFSDPGLATTAATPSAITELDGENGILRYRGYPIEQLAEQSTFLEVAYLLVHGELPDRAQHDSWVHEITTHTYIHENFRQRIYDAFHYDAHPMGMLTSGVAALSTFYPEAKDIEDPDNRLTQIIRLIAKIPTLAAAAYRHSQGQPFVFPDNTLDYPTNFLNMMYQVGGPYEIHPALRKAMDILLILHADHEQNCSTTTVRVVGSAHADPYSSIAAACAALYGPRHGGANEAVLNMLDEIGDYENVDSFIESVKSGAGRLMGFGHRVYKNYDPRATIIKQAADDVFEVTGKNPLLDIALKLEEVALSDEYFISRKLYPNVDFYSGLIYQAMGFPIEMFTVLFAIGRTPGWLAHWNEMLEQDSRIARPRQLYVGPGVRDYVPLSSR